MLPAGSGAMAAAVASPAPERVEFHRQPSAPAAWQRPAGAGPRPFLAKGGGKLSTSARPWAKVSRRMGSNGPSGVSPLTYDHRPADRPERWVAGRWKAAWEHHVAAQYGRPEPRPTICTRTPQFFDPKMFEPSKKGETEL